MKLMTDILKDVWVNKTKIFKENTINILKDMKIFVLGDKYDDILRAFNYKSSKMTNAKCILTIHIEDITI